MGDGVYTGTVHPLYIDSHELMSRKVPDQGRTHELPRSENLLTENLLKLRMMEVLMANNTKGYDSAPLNPTLSFSRNVGYPTRSFLLLRRPLQSRPSKLPRSTALNRGCLRGPMCNHRREG